MLETIIIFAATILLFIVGKIRSDIVALCSLAALLLTGVLTPHEALAGFSNSAVIIMVGLFVVGGAVFQTGLAATISGNLLKLAGKNEMRLFFLVVIVTAVTASFVSNTGTVALLLPIVLAMCKSANIPPSRLMIPLAFASSLGGVLTLIGTPPNLIVDGYLRDNGYGGFDFFDFTPIGLICLVVGLLALYPLTHFFLGKRDRHTDDAGDQTPLSELLHDYKIEDCVFRLQITPDSEMVGHTVKELDIRNKYGLTLLEVRHKVRAISNPYSVSQQAQVTADTRFLPDDLIYVLGHEENVKSFASANNLTLHDDTDEKGSKNRLDFYEIGLAEILLTPQSSLIGRPLMSANFRERFGINILAIKRKNHYIFDNIQDEKFTPGDMLLVHGAWGGLKSLAKKTREWIVIGNPEEKRESVPISHKAPLAAFIMLAMVVAMVFSDKIGVSSVAIVIAAALLMILTRCVRSVDAAYKMIGWESIVLIAAMMPMSTALSKTGISSFIATNIVGSLHSLGPVAALAGVYVVTSLLSTFISNSATAILVAPIAMEVAVKMGVSPTPLMMTAAVAASACFATPICTPPNAMVMSAGHYSFTDYVKVGLPLQLLLAIVCILAIPLLFPF